MAKKRAKKGAKRPARRRPGLARKGDGRQGRWLAGQEAFRDAWYAILLEMGENYQKDPRRQEKVDRAMRELLEDILKDLPE